MSIAPVTSSSTTPTSASTGSTSQADSSAAQLSKNFDTFLSLLTAQLQNQDPLSPMDTNQFTQQLVEFSGVEQQINSNKNLETLISLTKTRSGMDAVSYLGKTVTVTDGTAPLTNGQATWHYNLDSNAATTTLTVTDSNGKVVYVTPGGTAAGAHDFTWDGKDAAGNQLPNGTYTLTVYPLLADGSKVPSTVSSQSVIDEIDLSGSEPQLKAGPMSIPLSKATQISGS